MGLKHMPADKGYSWMVCLGAAIVMFSCFGVSKSLGVMLIAFQEEFQSDPSLTSLTVALLAAGFFLFVFFANTLGQFAGYRNVAIGGSILSFLSMLLTAFAPNIYFVVISLGLLSGISYSALYGPSLVILAQYFKKRRALANGIALAGGSVGQMCIPLLFNFFIEYYGFQGGILVFSGIVLQMLPATLLLRPPSFYLRPKKEVEIREMNGSSDRVQKKKEPGCCKRFMDTFKIMLDKELLRSLVFYMLLLSIVFAQLGYFTAVIFVPTAASSFFNNRMISITLVSVMGVSDLAGRLLGGYIADLHKIRINDLMGISLVVPGVVTIITGIYPTVWMMFVDVVFLGSFAGAYAGLVVPALADLFGLVKVSAGFGILTFIMGLALAPWPTVLSIIVKATGTYQSVLLIGGGCLAGGGLLFFLMTVSIVKDEKKKKKLKDDEEKQQIAIKQAEEEALPLEKKSLEDLANEPEVEVRMPLTGGDPEDEVNPEDSEPQAADV